MKLTKDIKKEQLKNKIVKVQINFEVLPETYRDYEYILQDFINELDEIDIADTLTVNETEIEDCYESN